jgi:YD repeat-containing protein
MSLAMASENAAISGSTCPGGATWCRKYGYDHFGNRWIASSLDTLHMATPTAQSAVDLDTNRLTSATYDAAGNLTAQPYVTTGGGSIAYDANNKAISFTAAGVSVGTKYDSGGRRVRKIHNGETTVWVYDAFGRLAAEYTTEAQTTPVGTYYRTADHLGSTRLVTDDLGRVRQRRDFFPFGEQIPVQWIPTPYRR